MSEVEIAKKVFERIESKDYDGARELLADEFEFSGAVPEPIGAEAWLSMQMKLGAAFPDWAFNLEDVRLDGDKVLCSSQITCTHTGALDVPDMGVPLIPATGKSISLPRESVELAFSGGKIASIRTSASPGAGVAGMLSQLGVELPA